MGFFKRLFGKKEKDSSLEANEMNQETPGKNIRETKEKVRNYHVSMNKDEASEHYKQWRVRKEHSDKTIKYFKTQKAAIDHAESLAESQGASVIIHKMDGSIRKKHYT